jgi:hypothetical protein
VYYKENPDYKRIHFNKGRRTLFELFLGDIERDMKLFSEAIEAVLLNEPFEKYPLGILGRILMKVIGRKIINCSSLISTGKTENSQAGMSVLIKREYYIVRLAGWFKNSFVILAKMTESGTSPHRKNRKLRFNWVKLQEDECVLLKQSIQQFYKTIKPS